jgi:hypothetical protein
MIKIDRNKDIIILIICSVEYNRETRHGTGQLDLFNAAPKSRPD